MTAVKTILGVLLFVLIVMFLASVYTITQGQQGILFRLGKLVEDKKTKQVMILNPGLHVKTPFIESVRTFDIRLQTLDIKSSRIVTKEKKDVIVDYFVKWRINDLARYYKATGGNAYKAETLLEQQLNTFTRAEFGKRFISDLVTGGRDDVMEILREKAQQQAKQLGVFVVDVRIKGIELPANTSNSIYQLMRADMQKMANRHRADGRATAEAIEASADAQVTVLLATARRDAKEIKAHGVAEAAQIYAQTFDRNRKFYDYYRSLKAYEASFNNKSDLLVLDQSSSFFNYFNHALQKESGTARQ